MRLKIAALMSAMALVVGVASVEASNLRMDVNGTVILDGSGGDVNVNGDAITWVGSVPGWTLIVNTGQGESSYAAGAGSMDLNFVATSAQGNSSDLVVMLSQQPGSTYPGWRMTIGGTQINAITTYSAFVGAAAFSTTTQIGSNLVAPGSPYALSGIGSVTVAPGYWLTQRIVIHPTSLSSASVSGDADLVPLPEPGSLVLLGTGLLGLAGYVRRRSS